MTIKIGFVGTGGIANHHLRTLAQLDEAELVAFCDVVEEKALAAASEYGGRAYSHYETLYDSEALDAVYICLPPFAHAQPCLLYTSPSPRDGLLSRMPSSA